MRKVLLTNDDSHRSPLLRLTIECLEQWFELVIVVPKEEQSWKGKSISRFEPLHIEEVDLFGRKAFTVSGTPADCVNIGVYELCGERPDLVISGLNTGLNTGTSFLLSSGTIGAALEANIAGIPGLALSQAFDSKTYHHFVTHSSLTQEMQEAIDSSSLKSFEQCLTFFLRHQELLRADIVWNVNFPHQRKEFCRMMLCSVGHSFYSRIFRKSGRHYEHHLAVDEIRRDKDGNYDLPLLRSGDITCSPIDIRELGQVDPSRYGDEIQIFSDDQAAGVGDF